MNFDSAPVELQELVAAELRDGHYTSPSDALIAGMRLLREQRERHEQFTAEIKEALEQVDRGEYLEFDDESLRAYFDQLKQRAREEFERRKAEVQIGLDQLDNGEYRDFDRESLRELFDGLKERARRAAVDSQTQSS